MHEENRLLHVLVNQPIEQTGKSSEISRDYLHFIRQRNR